MTRKELNESNGQFITEDSSGYVLASWIAFWAGIFGMGLVAFPISIVLANEAIRRGGSAKLPRLLSIVFLFVGIILFVVAFAVFMAL